MRSSETALLRNRNEPLQAYENPIGAAKIRLDIKKFNFQLKLDITSWSFPNDVEDC